MIWKQADLCDLGRGGVDCFSAPGFQFGQHEYGEGEEKATVRFCRYTHACTHARTSREGAPRLWSETWRRRRDGVRPNWGEVGGKQRAVVSLPQERWNGVKRHSSTLATPVPSTTVKGQRRSLFLFFSVLKRVSKGGQKKRRVNRPQRRGSE